MGQLAAAAGKNAKGAYRKALIARRSEVLEKLGIKPAPFAEAGCVSEDEQAQTTHDEFVSSRLNRLDCENLRLVEAALERLDSGEFGVCEVCGRPIPARRLEAVPWAQCCVACQEAAGSAVFAHPGFESPFHPDTRPFTE
jgi:DnaK suppressor protein